MASRSKQALVVLTHDGLGQEPTYWHEYGLPGSKYHWTGLGACLAANLKERTGYDCGKVVWLPKPNDDVLKPHRIVWCSPDINAPIPAIVLWLWPYSLVSVSITKEFAQFEAASPAILLKSSSSPWTVDATFNTASNVIYAVGPGGNSGNAVLGSSGSGAGGGGGACVFASNYNNSWTPGTSTATFQVTGANTTTTVNNASFRTQFDGTAFVASPGSAGDTGAAKGLGGTIANSTVPAGGTKTAGGDGSQNSTGSPRAGGAGGGAGGTTGDGGAGGGFVQINGGGTGGGGADNGDPGGNTPTSGNTGAPGGKSGVVGSVAGAGGTSTVPPTSGTLGAGAGGGSAFTSTRNGANGSSGGTQFDATHGAGGGGGGGSGGNPGGNGGNGGNYGGGAGGPGNASSGLVGTRGTGGDGIVFITWVPSITVTRDFRLGGESVQSIQRNTLMTTEFVKNMIYDTVASTETLRPVTLDSTVVSTESLIQPKRDLMVAVESLCQMNLDVAIGLELSLDYSMDALTAAEWTLTASAMLTIDSSGSIEWDVGVATDISVSIEYVTALILNTRVASEQSRWMAGDLSIGIEALYKTASSISVSLENLRIGSSNFAVPSEFIHSFFVDTLLGVEFHTTFAPHPTFAYVRQAPQWTYNIVAQRLFYTLRAPQWEYVIIVPRQVGGQFLPEVAAMSAVAPSQIQTMGIDFGDFLPLGVTLVGTPTLILSTSFGSDPNASGRASAGPVVGTISKANNGTGLTNTSILWQVTGCLPGVTYVAEVTCDRSDGSDAVEASTRFPCIAPH